MAILPEDIRDIENTDIRQQIQIMYEYIKYMREMIEFWASNAGRGVGPIADSTQKMIDASKTFTQSDWEQEDETAEDYIKNKPIIPEGATIDTELSATSTNPVQNKVIASALSSKANSTDVPSKVSELQNDSGFITTETDPTVPTWAKATTKPRYTASEVGAVPTTRKINNKALSTDITLTASDVGALPSSTSIPNSTSDLTNDSNFVSDTNYVHTDNNFTSILKHKLEEIADGAEVNVQADWNQTNSNEDDYIKNKPEIDSGADYIKLPDGTLIQWGNGTFGTMAGSATTNALINLPQAYIDDSYVVFVNNAYRYPSQIDLVATKNPTQIRIYSVNRTTDSLTRCEYSWLAIGKWK